MLCRSALERTWGAVFERPGTASRGFNKGCCPQIPRLPRVNSSIRSVALSGIVPAVRVPRRHHFTAPIQLARGYTDYPQPSVAGEPAQGTQQARACAGAFPPAYPNELTVLEHAVSPVCGRPRVRVNECMRQIERLRAQTLQLYETSIYRGKLG